MQSDSSTDEDNPSPPEPRYGRGAGRPGGGGPKGYGNARGGGGDFGAQLYQLQYDAYAAVIRALRAQKEALAWDEVEMVAGLRKSLKISDEKHREVMQAAHADEGLRRIADWVLRQGAYGGATPHYDATPGASSAPGMDFGPASGGGRKKQKLGPGSLPPPPMLQAPPPKDRKGHSQQSLPGGGRGGAAASRKGRGGSGPVGRGRGGRPGGLSAAPGINEHVGKKVKTFWEGDEKAPRGWYDAIISNYNPDTGAHCLLYNRDTPNEEMEWIDLNTVDGATFRMMPDPPDLSVLAAPPKPDPLLPLAPTPKEGRRSGTGSRGRGRGRGKPQGRPGGIGRGPGGLDAASNGKRKERDDAGEGDLMINLDHVGNLDDIDEAKATLKQREAELRAQLDAMSDSDDEDDTKQGEQLAPIGPPPDDDEEEVHRRQGSRGGHGEEEEEGEGEGGDSDEDGGGDEEEEEEEEEDEDGRTEDLQ